MASAGVAGVCLSPDYFASPFAAAAGRTSAAPTFPTRHVPAGTRHHDAIVSVALSRGVAHGGGVSTSPNPIPAASSIFLVNRMHHAATVATGKCRSAVVSPTATGTTTQENSGSQLAPNGADIARPQELDAGKLSAAVRGSTSPPSQDRSTPSASQGPPSSTKGHGASLDERCTPSGDMVTVTSAPTRDSYSPMVPISPFRPSSRLSSPLAFGALVPVPLHRKSASSLLRQQQQRASPPSSTSASRTPAADAAATTAPSEKTLSDCNAVAVEGGHHASKGLSGGVSSANATAHGIPSWPQIVSRDQPEGTGPRAGFVTPVAYTMTSNLTTPQQPPGSSMLFPAGSATAVAALSPPSPIVRVAVAPPAAAASGWTVTVGRKRLPVTGVGAGSPSTSASGGAAVAPIATVQHLDAASVVHLLHSGGNHHSSASAGPRGVYSVATMLALRRTPLCLLSLTPSTASLIQHTFYSLPGSSSPSQRPPPYVAKLALLANAQPSGGGSSGGAPNVTSVLEDAIIACVPIPTSSLLRGVDNTAASQQDSAVPEDGSGHHDGASPASSLLVAPASIVEVSASLAAITCGASPDSGSLLHQPPASDPPHPATDGSPGHAAVAVSPAVLIRNPVTAAVRVAALLEGTAQGWLCPPSMLHRILDPLRISFAENSLTNPNLEQLYSGCSSSHAAFAELAGAQSDALTPLSYAYIGSQRAPSFLTESPAFVLPSYLATSSPPTAATTTPVPCPWQVVMTLPAACQSNGYPGLASPGSGSTAVTTPGLPTVFSFPRIVSDNAMDAFADGSGAFGPPRTPIVIGLGKSAAVATAGLPANGPPPPPLAGGHPPASPLTSVAQQIGSAQTASGIWDRSAVTTPLGTGGGKTPFGSHRLPRELHQKVLSVLSRVTPAKYNELRTELLNLPIRQADDEQLRKVVDVVFQKGISEEQFSQLYADLVASIFEVAAKEVQLLLQGAGSNNTGDAGAVSSNGIALPPGRLAEKTGQLAHRLRLALLRKCQQEFENGVAMSDEALLHQGDDLIACTPLSSPDAAFGTQQRGSPDDADLSSPSDRNSEARAARRKRLCGIVRFVGELYSCKLVSDDVVDTVLTQLMQQQRTVETYFADVVEAMLFTQTYQHLAPVAHSAPDKSSHQHHHHHHHHRGGGSPQDLTYDDVWHGVMSVADGFSLSLQNASSPPFGKGAVGGGRSSGGGKKTNQLMLPSDAESVTQITPPFARSFASPPPPLPDESSHGCATPPTGGATTTTFVKPLLLMHAMSHYQETVRRHGRLMESYDYIVEVFHTLLTTVRDQFFAAKPGRRPDMMHFCMAQAAFHPTNRVRCKMQNLAEVLLADSAHHYSNNVFVSDHGSHTRKQARGLHLESVTVASLSTPVGVMAGGDFPVASVGSATATPTSVNDTPLAGGAVNHNGTMAYASSLDNAVRAGNSTPPHTQATSPMKTPLSLSVPATPQKVQGGIAVPFGVLLPAATHATLRNMPGGGTGGMGPPGGAAAAAYGGGPMLPPPPPYSAAMVAAMPSAPPVATTAGGGLPASPPSFLAAMTVQQTAAATVAQQPSKSVSPLSGTATPASPGKAAAVASEEGTKAPTLSWAQARQRQRAAAVPTSSDATAPTDAHSPESSLP